MKHKTPHTIQLWRTLWKPLFFLLLLVAQSTIVFAQLRKGQAVVTCFSGFEPTQNAIKDADVVGIIDIRDHSTAPQWNGSTVATGAQTNWGNVPMIHFPNWTSKRMGQVFGIALDREGFIYVTAATIYGVLTTTQPYPTAIAPNQLGPAGAGGVYRLDPISGVVTDLVTTSPTPNVIGTKKIYNTGPGLGNIAFDAVHNQLFVTNFEDGKIYRLKMDGTVLSTYDPFGDDNGVAGFADAELKPTNGAGERIWGIGVYNNHVVFGTWFEDTGLKNAASNGIYAVPLDPTTGEFTGTLNGANNYINAEIAVRPSLETILPLATPAQPYSNPVSDIEFSHDGKMLVTERTMNSTANDPYRRTLGSNAAYAHQARLLEFDRASTNFANVRQIFVGNYNGTVGNGLNSAGGTDYSYASFNTLVPPAATAEQRIVVTEDYTLGEIYGLQSTPIAGNVSAPNTDPAYVLRNGFFVDFDGLLGSQDKTSPGDVDVYRDLPDACNCFALTNIALQTIGQNQHILSFQVTNNSGQATPAEWVLITLPNGAQRWVDIPSTPNGSTVTVSLTFNYTGALPSPFNFTAQLHGEKVGDQYLWCCEPCPFQVTPPCLSASPRWFWNKEKKRWELFVQMTNQAGQNATAAQLISSGGVILNPSYFSVPIANGASVWLPQNPPTPPTGIIVTGPNVPFSIQAILYASSGSVSTQCCTRTFRVKPYPIWTTDLPTVAGLAFHDTNGNGWMDLGEEPLKDLYVFLSLENGTKLEGKTDANGWYVFQKLNYGDAFTLSYRNKEGAVIEIGQGQVEKSDLEDYAYWGIPIQSGMASLSVQAFHDQANPNGLWDETLEKPLENIKIGLYQGETLIEEDFTRHTGFAFFHNLREGSAYTLKATAPEDVVNGQKWTITSSESQTFIWQGANTQLKPISFGLVSPTASDKEEMPERFGLLPNYPNPFNPATTVRYFMKEAANVKIIVYDLTGKQVATLVNGFQSAGNHQIQFDASQLASGTYLYRMQAGTFTATQRMTLMK